MEVQVLEAEPKAGEPNSRTFECWAAIAAATHHKRSRKDYRTALESWCAHLAVSIGTAAAATALIEATPLHASMYRIAIEAKPGLKPRAGYEEQGSTWSPATVRKHLGLLRGIYRSLMEQGLVRANPFARIVPPRIAYRKRPIEGVPFEKVWELINSPGGVHDKYPRSCNRVRRDRAVLAVLFGAGLRVSEVTNLRVMDFRSTDEGVHILHLRRTKKGTADEVVLPQWCVEMVGEWVEIRKQEKAMPGDFLFCPLRLEGTRHLPGKVSNPSIAMWLKRYAEMIGLNPEIVCPHSARVTAISKLLDQGIPHKEVSQFSRHSTVQMVDYYDRRRHSRSDSVGRLLDYRLKPKPRR